MDTSKSFSPQKAKNRVQTEINEILQCLENKKIEMFTEIETFEKEYISKQQQQQKKINKLNSLIEQTEELGDNSLLEVQNRIIQDLQNELSIASIQESDCSVEFEWGFSRDVISKINSITLKRLDTDKDEGGTLLTPDYGSEATWSMLYEVSEAVDSDLIEKQSGFPEGGFGGRNPGRNRETKRGFNKDGSLDGESNVVNRTRRRDRERNSSNRGGFVERTEYALRSKPPTERVQWDADAGEFGKHTDSYRGRRPGRESNDLIRGGHRGGGGYRRGTDSNQGRRAPRDRTNVNRGSPNREVVVIKGSFDNAPRIHPGHNRERRGRNPRRPDTQRTNVDKQADRDNITAQSELPDNDIEDSINFVPENRRERIRSYPQCKTSHTSQKSHPHDIHDDDSWDVD